MNKFKINSELKYKKHIRMLLIFLALIIFLLIQKPYWINRPFEFRVDPTSWRQSDTYSIAVNYFQFDMNPLKPQLNYDGVGDNFAQLEPQILPYASAIIFKLFGKASPIVPRIFSNIFYIFSAVFLFLMMREYSSFWASFIAFLVYLFMPLSLIIGHNIQPESCLIMFFNASLYFLIKYDKDMKDNDLIWASVMMSLAILEKTTAAFWGIVFIYVLFKHYKFDFLKKKITYISALICLLPTLMHIAYTSKYAKLKFINHIAENIVFTERVLWIFREKTQTFFYDCFSRHISWTIIILATIGIILCIEKKKYFQLSIFVSLALELIIVVAGINFVYYLVFMLPVLAIFIALLIDEVMKWRLSVMVFLAILLIFSMWNSRTVFWDYTRELPHVFEYGKFISDNVEFDESVVLGAIHPIFLNAANRRGYRANAKMHEDIPEGIAEELDYFISKGVKYFAVPPNNEIYKDEDGKYFKYLDENFEKVVDDGVYKLYELQ